MAAPAYTIRLLGAQLAPGAVSHSALVPNGFIWVIRSMTWAITTGGAGTLLVWVNLGTPAGPVIYILAQSTVTGSTVGTQDIRQAMVAGEQLSAQNTSTSATAHILVTGYQLSA